APLRLRLRNTLDAMRPSLVLEDRVRAVALDREHDLLEAAALVRAPRELLPLEAAALGVAGQHPEEVGRPERGLVAADALADLDDHVLPVGWVGLDECELQLLLEVLHPLLELGDELAKVAVPACLGEVGRRRAPLLGELVRLLELLQAPPDLSRLAMVVVDRRVGHPLLGLAIGALQLLDEP